VEGVGPHGPSPDGWQVRVGVRRRAQQGGRDHGGEEEEEDYNPPRSICRSASCFPDGCGKRVILEG
jgi:hypothetical protein